MGGQLMAQDLEEKLDVNMGRPTRRQLAAMEEERRQQQQQMLMQQQMWMQSQMQGMQQQMQLTPIRETQMPEEAHELAKQGFQRDGPSPLDLSAGVDAQIVKSKILELAGHIIGETDDIELDTPLMEAGLTSNSAVLLRDELSKDLPGFSLPATLIFDYPSITSISDFVVEKSKGKK